MASNGTLPGTDLAQYGFDKAYMYAAPFDYLMSDYTINTANPNDGIQQRYTRQPSQSGGLIGGDSLAPMRMYQNRQGYQSQYGTPESLAPMQMLNQYRQSTGAETGAAGTPGMPGSTGTTGGK